MTLFIDRTSLHCWTDNSRTPPVRYWSARLPVLLSDAGLIAPPAGVQIQEWAIDTGNTGEALAWRHHLLVAGLDPRVKRVSTVAIGSTIGLAKQIVPVRSADLWLVSNIAGTTLPPFKIELDPGVPFLDVPTIPDPNLQRPLIGMRSLRRARVRVEFDFAASTISMWTP